MRAAGKSVTVMVFALAVLLGAACGPGRYWSTQRARGPDGTMNYLLVECRVRRDCLSVIGHKCAHGYQIVNDDGRASKATMLVHCEPPSRVAVPAASAQATAMPSEHVFEPRPASSALPVREFPE